VRASGAPHCITPPAPKRLDPDGKIRSPKTDVDD
jgi:hypothetical protein